MTARYPACPTPRTYYVVSPETQIYPGSDLEPPEYGRYVDEVKATSKREAVKIAYADRNSELNDWAAQARSEGRNPFAGVQVEHPHCEHGMCPDAPLDADGFNCSDCRREWVREWGP